MCRVMPRGPSPRVEWLRCQSPESKNKMQPEPVVFGYTIAFILASPLFTALPRDLDIVEICSGVGAITQAGWDAELNAAPFDKFRINGITNIIGSPHNEDLTTEPGFLNAVKLVMRLRVGGLLWLAPVCASWVYLNVSRTKRSVENDYWGDTNYPPVAITTAYQ